MTQIVDKQLAIGEVLLTGMVLEKDFATFIRAYPIPPDLPEDAPALMVLEEQPHHVIEQKARQDLLRFERFNPDFDFAPYTAGRIFHDRGELRWERQASHVRVVYTGREENKPRLNDAREIQLDAYASNDRAYLLFGKRLKQDELDLIGPTAEQGDFAEVRIPRLLRYPRLDSLLQAERIQVVMCEYSDSSTEVNVAYRFKKLQPFESKR